MRTRLSRLAGALTLALLAALLAGVLARPQSTRAAAPPGFAYRCGIHFCLDGKTFYFAGANTYDVFTYGGSYGDIETQWMDKARIDAHFARLQQDKVSVLRLWMFSHETWHGFEPAKGVYSNEQFSLFDYVIESAKAHNVKLIPVFENFWEAYGGIDTRLKWEGLNSGYSERWKFFNKAQCPGCFTQYKNYVSYALNRVNHYSGVKYKDDPTIFAWELMNEPRYPGATPNEDSTGTTLRAWVDEMGAFIKGIDPNHLLGAGLEGHEARYGFGGNEGNPFISIQQSPYIDFTSAHPYPTEGWAALSIAQTQALIRAWISDSHNQVGKPFYMGEFNTHANASTGTRAQWWTAIYGEMEASDGDGSGFWWYDDRIPSYDSNFGVWQGQPELAIFRQHSANMAAKNGSTSPTSTPTATRTSAPTNTPTRTPTVAPTRTPTATPGTPTVPGNLPDLTVSWMSIGSQTNGCPQGPLGLSVRVANIGTANAGTFAVTANGATQTVAGLAAGQSVSVWFPSFVYGNVNTATVDSANQVAESNESNNQRSEMVPVPTPIFCPTATPTPSTPTPTQWILIIGRVTVGSDTGPGLAGVNVAVFYGVPSGQVQTDASGYYRIELPAPLNQEATSVTPSAAGYTFTPASYSWITTRSGPTVTTRDFVAVPVTPVPTNTPTPALLPDLTVSSMAIVPQWSGCPNAPLVLSVRVSNIGAASAGAFAVTANGATQQVAGLAAGQSTTLQFTSFYYSSPNTATVDSANQVAESDETNNQRSQLLPIPDQAPCTPTPTTPTATRTPTPTPTVTPTPGTGACSPVTRDITVPFTYDGAGTFCWRTTKLGSYINSWNLTSLKINGVDFTNRWANSYPAPIGGYYYISYSAQYAWSHFEAK
jgi:mannan endo-1,4-beta-mannosidase